MRIPKEEKFENNMREFFSREQLCFDLESMTFNSSQTQCAFTIVVDGEKIPPPQPGPLGRLLNKRTHTWRDGILSSLASFFPAHFVNFHKTHTWRDRILSSLFQHILSLFTKSYLERQNIYFQMQKNIFRCNSISSQSVRKINLG